MDERIEVKTKYQDIPFNELKMAVSAGKKVDLEDRLGDEKHLLQKLFKRAASIHPQNVAIQSLESSFTFSEIDHLSDCLSFELASKGIKLLSRVLIRLPVDYRYVVAMLGIIKAGGTYIPISMEEPVSRLDYFVQNSEAVAVISNSAQINAFKNLHCPLILIDQVIARNVDKKVSAEWVAILHEDNVSLSPNAPVYVMYTSGTTGLPKGVAISHEALLNFLFWQKDFLNFSDKDVMLQRSPYSFDFSITEFWLPLVFGATIAIPPKAWIKHQLKLKEFMALTGVTVAQFVPKLLDEFLAANNASFYLPLSKLKHVITNGEALSDNTRRHFYVQFPYVTLHNNYGPTEATVAVTNYDCPKEDVTLPMFIGSAAYSTRIYIVNENFEPVKNGELGELCIGGEQLSTGYLNNKSLTDEKFVFSEIFAEKIYRTGDLAKATLDGSIEILGRSDDQFKIRGMLVQPLGIERVIENEAGVAHAVVKKQTVKGRNGRNRESIVAYIKPEKNVCDSIELVNALKTNLKNLLIPHEVPTRFAIVSDFPTNRNGKIDRKALPPVEYERNCIAQNDDIKPRTLNEEILFDVFSEVFDVQVGRNTTLGCTGLDSLDMICLMTETSERGIELPMDMLLDHMTTVSKLAEIARPSSLSSMSVTNFHEDQKEIQREASEAFDWAIESNTPPKVVVFHISLPEFRIISRLRLRECLLAEFQRLLDRGITFAIPAFSFSFCRSRTYHFKKTRSETGLLPIWLLDALEVLRTPNPVYSFVAGGPLATEISDCNNSSTFSDDSYFGWFEKNNARIVTIGTYAMTQTHRTEYLAGVPYHKYLKISGLGEYGKGPVETHAIVYSRDIDSLSMMDHFAQNVHKTVEILDSSLKRRPFLGTSINYICCEDLNDRLIPILKKDPFCILKHLEFVKMYIATDDFKNLQLE